MTRKNRRFNHRLDGPAQRRFERNVDAAGLRRFSTADQHAGRMLDSTTRKTRNAVAAHS